MPSFSDKKPGPNEQIQRMQNSIRGNFHLLQKQLGKGAQGQFKKVVPISNNLCVAIVPKSFDSQQQITEELNHLNELRKNGLPGIQTKGGLFEVSPKHDAFIMKFVPNSTLFDAKFPENANKLILPVLMGLSVPSGKENWIPGFTKVMGEVKELHKNQTYDAKSIKENAKILEHQVSAILEKMEKNQIMIGDLQLLVGGNPPSINIIDPLDVLHVTLPKSPGEAPIFQKRNYASGELESTEISDGYKLQLRQAHELLINLKKTCEDIANTPDADLENAIHKKVDFFIQQNRQYSPSTSPAGSPGRPPAGRRKASQISRSPTQRVPRDVGPMTHHFDRTQKRMSENTQPFLTKKSSPQKKESSAEVPTIKKPKM